MGLASVGGAGKKEAGCHPSFTDELLDQPEAERLARVLVRVQMVGLVHDQQVPRRGVQQALMAPPAVRPQGRKGGDDLVVDGPEIRPGSVHLRPIERHADVELGLEPILPLLDQARGGQDQTPADLAAGEQGGQNQPRLDRFAKPHVIGDQQVHGPLLQGAMTDPKLMGEEVDVRAGEDPPGVV